MTRFAIRSLIIGGGIALSWLASLPASAQATCPVGFYYSYNYGCVPDSGPYNDFYGDNYYDDAPVYDPYGLAFGFGGGGGFRGGRGGGGFHGGGRVGGGHGGGGGRGGGGGHGGGGHH